MSQPEQQFARGRHGAWLSWTAVQAVCRLDIRPASAWRVFLVVLLTSARYGGRPARLGVNDIAQRAGLSRRTVQSALTKLIADGLLERVGRYRSLAVSGDILTRTTSGSSAGEGASGGARKLAPPKRGQARASPTCSLVFFSSEERDEALGPFSPAQRTLIGDVFQEADDLLGSDVGGLPLRALDAGVLGLPPGTTFGEALRLIRERGSRRQARDFTRAVLTLRSDERVQGTDLSSRA